MGHSSTLIKETMYTPGFYNVSTKKWMSTDTQREVGFMKASQRDLDKYKKIVKKFSKRLEFTGGILRFIENPGEGLTHNNGNGNQKSPNKNIKYHTGIYQLQ
jgi:hypothetical protein